jgi:chloride channel 3/4/5
MTGGSYDVDIVHGCHDPVGRYVWRSKWCGDIFGKRGIYESWIRLNEYLFLDHRDDTTPPDVSAHRVMTTVDRTRRV